MGSKCPECNQDVMEAQVSLHFNVGSADWLEALVIAGICPRCGRVDLHMATPAQFKQLLDLQKAKAAVAG
jgi:endogenous inhibitor of DNA gyrase (YacG/DUF329 family)